MWGHTEAPMLHVGICYSFEKKKRLFIVDYIKPSPVYQVKCKLVFMLCTLMRRGRLHNLANMLGGQALLCRVILPPV